ncbi:MAG: protein phosphatase 2C domain-containing protein [Jaaginema sp. PMC 1079.18]|nr:protein phosphatase 2C domain-containing protein [Jaaginema sp. PMC 1080.18]MEC4850589.1 protein phosphatase 2C domain-containing protein [Jaaginema sp. PMC 1079.18]MEC4867079.1 protein phosphatase 2C domain-containing protein [Jaaginema sp. PMC 1078.18]
MHEPAVQLHCSNPSCQSVNPPDANFCQHCRVPLVRRYLWIVGDGIEGYNLGSLIGDRYWRLGENWVMDTQPALNPQLPDEVPSGIQPYLRLVAYRPHIPQVYGQVIPSQVPDSEALWLLEYGSFPANTQAQIQAQTFCPSLAQVWEQASPLRQLNWLWQIARLWQPCKAQKVTQTLLAPHLLRTHHGLLLVRELRPDAEKAPTMAQLGQLWQTWLPGASEALKPFLEPLCQHLTEGTLQQGDRLVATIDRALEELGRTPERTYQIYTRTDTGPQRHHNEDACFPEDGSFTQSAQGANVLAIVCDGIGGHDGGEIASQIAIETIQQGVAQLSYNVKPATPFQIQEILEQTACAANDAISDRNDTEQRHERQRMGTTLVMALGRGHEMYFAHVGDSRIYWLTRSGCYQVTLDDDVASREVRMGYALHREALQYPSGGALVQALGMGSSAHLRPTIGRKILDEDGLFLLCSDGLSDFDRIEQYWETEILPVLTEDLKLPAVGNRLIEIANTQNGHDNVTIALLSYRVKLKPQRSWPQLSPPKLKSPSAELSTATPTASNPPASVTPPGKTKPPSAMPTGVTVISSPPQRPKSSVKFLLALAIFMGLIGGLVALSYWFFPELRSRLIPTVNPPTPTPTPTPTTTPQLPTAPLDGTTLNIGDVVVLNKESLIYQDPSLTSASIPIPPDSVVGILSRETRANETWLQVYACLGESEAEITVDESRTVETGWVQAIASATRISPSEIPPSCPNPPPANSVE